MGELVAAAHAPRQVAVFLVLAGKAVLHLLLGVERLDDAQSANGLLDVAHDGAQLVLLLERHALEVLAHTAHDQAGNRQQDEHKERQLPAHKEHHRQAHHYHDGVLEHHVERHHHRVLHLGNVAAHAGHHVALALTGEETYGQRHHLVVDHRPEVAHHARAQRYHEIGSHVGGAGLEARHHHQCSGDARQRHTPATAGYDALHIVVEVVDHHLVDARRAPRGVVVVSSVKPKEHLQDGDDKGKREEREQRGKDVEHDVQRQLLLIGWHKAP